ncbi:carbohydrate-binding module family 1 protein [Annulohypoxylon maeteangense]|uniref:carbohydrate-binding module family 1 protein n=1 Tax=Annulohypoxylon maeteangense TaxID=1927788 RepID=UPI0020072527|nr:carbohydrate-binding module family 1 protein [Annulohypoxylon maeteangense]KAI0883087.1 carbohydrate-binding module family 1 protein [Annulohypoxylon maeteangense]
MASMKTSALFAALASVSTVAAHGHVNNVVIDGVFYQGYDPTTFPYQQSPPTVVGWTTSQTDNGFIEPNSFSSADIICHKNAKNAGGHAQVKAGDSIAITWNTWPESHKGPMIDYLAPCGDSCETVDKETLEFFKIDEVGLLDDTTAPGNWGSDVLISNGLTWMVQIPANIKAGNYVLRHETIALHSAGSTNGAQAYPQCFNLQITGDGTDSPAGTLGTKLYTPQDPGILINIYTTGIKYTIPGPTLIAGASSSVAQTSSAITSTGTATVGSGVAATSPAASTTAAAATSATTTAQKVSTSSPKASAPTTLATSTKAAAPTTAPTTTTAAAATTTAAATGNVNAQSLYGQCGGSNFAGPTACAEGGCKSWNPYYHQCVATA